MTMSLRHWFIFKALAVCSLSLACRNANASNFLARGMPATQSRTYMGQGAGLAVDGVTGTASFADNGVSQENVPAWCQVDLGQNCLVYSVTVTAPLQDYQFLSNFIVTVGADTATDSAFLCATYNSLSVQPGAVIVTTCISPLVGRYVTVTRQVLDPQPRSLSISELQVTGTRISGNQAYYQPTTQIGTYAGNYAGFAVDNDPNYSTCALAAADTSLPAWWQVDLGDSFRVKSVWLLATSANEGIYYLQNLTVTVDTAISTSSQNMCYIFNNGSSSAKVALVSPSVHLILTCTQPIVGRYVTVRRLGGYQPSALLLCDVQVFGDFIGSIPSGPTTPPFITPSAATTLTSTTIPQTMRSPSTNLYSSTVQLSAPFISINSQSPPRNPTVEGGLTPGVVAGIVIGAALGAALLVCLLVLVVCVVQKRKMRDDLKTSTQPVNTSTCACRSRATTDFASKEDGNYTSLQSRLSDESKPYEKMRTGTNNINNMQAVYEVIHVPA